MTKHILTEAEKERIYDLERSGQIYIATNEPLATSCASLWQPVPDHDILIDHIDALPVLARYMADEPDDKDYGGLGIMKVIWNGMEISTDGRSYISLPTSGDMSGDMKLHEWAAIKALAHTDIPERLIAIAQRYPRYWDTLSPTPPAAPASAVITTRDSSDSGATQWTDYRAGNVVIGHIDKGEWPTHLSANQLIIHRTDIDEPITGDLVCGLINDLTTLLGHSGVRSALGLPALPAVRVERDICTDRQSPHFGHEDGTDYICGESSICFPDSGAPPTLMTYDTDRYDSNTERNVNDLITLLTCPQVQAARVRSEAGAPLKKAA